MTNYLVLTREHTHWTEAWEAHEHPTLEAARQAVAAARAAGYEAELKVVHDEIDDALASGRLAISELHTAPRGISVRRTTPLDASHDDERPIRITVAQTAYIDLTADEALTVMAQLGKAMLPDAQKGK